MKRIYSIVDKALSIYNKYRSPEARAILIEINNNELIVEFKGSFCYTCGIRDWIEDFKYILIDLGLDNELVNVIERENDTRIGVFRIKTEGETIDR